MVLLIRLRAKRRSAVKYQIHGRWAAGQAPLAAGFERRTPNIELPPSNSGPSGDSSSAFDVRRWTFDVGCSVFATLDFRLQTLDCFTYFEYASNVTNPKNVESTSFRSDTQATDSTWIGCKPKRAATKAPRQTAPVMRRSTRKSREVLAACNRRFVKW